MQGEDGGELKVAILVSACLMGEKVRYNGSDVQAEDRSFDKLKERCSLVSYCPEVGGGLPVPRPPAELQRCPVDANEDSKTFGPECVVTNDGKDVTEHFWAGAQEALRLCKMRGVKIAILTERSPSCGVTTIYDGTFSGRKIAGMGLTCRLLSNNGISVFSQYQLEEAMNKLDELQA